MRACLVLAVVLGSTAIVAADGERSPMLGVDVVGGDTTLAPSQQDQPLAGVGLDVALWHGRFGIGGEASERWALMASGVRATVLGASARLRIYDCLTPSLLDPRDVELGVELQAIVERAWWSGPEQVDPTAFGLGVAVRLRGGGDADGSLELAESRLFLRVMAAKWGSLDEIARTTEPQPPAGRAVTVLLGIGASFGAGSPSYVHQFRLHPFRPTMLW
jgi:hypothetical protein